MLQKSRIDPETGAKIPASIKWVSQELKITKKMLLRWRAQEAKIVAARKGSRQVERPPKGVWHEMEAALHTRFIAIRKQGKPVGQRWFIREGKKIFEEREEVRVDAANKKHYPCTFSNGWFEGFCERWSISWRVKTKVGQDTPDDKAKAIQTFLQEIRRKSQPPARSQQQNRFLPQYIYNMDQTPLPFEFLQNRTFDTKANLSVPW
ncbi:hypothetical protein EV426DRAFT_287409 [Tirmania nivea]|nr:hypothetical protein EV426DRAFT_287409 [Tirmania nivea]